VERAIFTLEDKIIFITGAASGIGKATSVLCKDFGARVVAADLSAPDDIKTTLSLSEQDLAIQLDVSDEASVTAAMAQVKEIYGQLDGLVNSAGISGMGAAHQVPLASWEKTIAVHMTGTFLLCQKALELFLAQKSGAIVNVASTYGLIGGTGNFSYNSAKGGIVQMTRCLAADYGPMNIRANCVAPGYIETPMTTMLDGEAAEPFRNRFVEMHSLKRAGKPEEVARAIAFLLSDAASYVTGVALPVDGGYSAAKEIIL
jgi:NAD(P)-dependent dehydrogenase (short-subunit alcohol dehydrogenase family)